MKYILLLFIALCFPPAIEAQHAVNVFIKDAASKEAVGGATVSIPKTGKTVVADKDGKAVIERLSEGTVTFIVSAVGYEKTSKTLILPLANGESPVIFYIAPSHHEMEEVVVSSTRTGRTIGNVPTRVEVIDLEEIEEKNNMRPSNVSMILHESTGIQMQQTSPTSLNSSIRIQGLDGRYTQLLKDGYSNFGNFASGLSIMEIPPLDLAQVEVIKGPASTLYGGGAIAGVVNFISKTPKFKPEYSFIASQSHVGQTTVGAFTSARNKKVGYTFLGLGNLQKPYDVDKDEFTELAKSKDFTFHPKLFFYPNERSYVMIGNSLTAGNRTGGDMFVVKGRADANHTYFETNKSLRNTFTAEFDTKPDEAGHFTGKTSFSYFNRDLLMHEYQFGGINYNSFTDLTYVKRLLKHTLVLGSNFIYDQFKEKKTNSGMARDFVSNTAGLYVQNTWDISDLVKLEAGLRGDAVKYANNDFSKTEYFVLPRASVLFHITEQLTSRIGGGLGYKTPTLFTEATESMHYRHILPLNDVTSEKSYGGTADINYKTHIGEDFDFSFNHMFFYTRINNALVLQQNATEQFVFKNTDKPVNSKGFETNLKLVYRDALKFFAGYTFTDAKAKYLTGNQFIPLVIKNRVNMVLFYENENLKVGLEGYHSDWQYLTNGSKAPSYWDLGAMVEKRFGNISVFVNAENFTDARQNKIKSVVNGPHTDPTFDDIWSYHPEGRVISVGVKLKL